MMSMFSKLSIYTAHLRPQAANRPEHLVLVKEGFALWAFVFPIFWLLYHRLWVMLGFFMAGNILLALSLELIGLDPLSLSILQIALQVWVGFEANDAYRAKLAKLGYLTTALISGESRIRAEQRFFDSHAHLFSVS